MGDLLRKLVDVLSDHPPVLVASVIAALFVVPLAQVIAKRAEKAYDRHVASGNSILLLGPIVLLAAMVHSLVITSTSIWCYFGTDLMPFGASTMRHPYPRWNGFSLYASISFVPLLFAVMTRYIGRRSLKDYNGPTLGGQASLLLGIVATWIFAFAVTSVGSIPPVFTEEIGVSSLKQFAALTGLVSLLAPYLIVLFGGLRLLALGMWRAAKRLDQELHRDDPSR